VKVELLYFDGCPYYKKAGELLEEVLREEGIEAKVEMIKVENDEDAKRLRFIGSPTIRINGVDVQEEVRGLKDYGMKCRIYLTKEGTLGYPPKEMIRRAVRWAS
jgi:glutaredoxin